MNEALRLLRKLVRRMGHDIRKSEQLVLRPIANIDALEHGQELAAIRTAFDQDGPHDNADLSHLTIYLRSCIRKNRNVNARPRMASGDDEENALRCITSLVHSINTATSAFGQDCCSVIALDDRSDPLFIEKLDKILSHLSCTYDLRQTQETGQGPSLHEQFLDSRVMNSLVYFCEDDYLHEREAICEMITFYRQIYTSSGVHAVIYPQEHKDLYEGYYPSYIIAGEHRRWRTMNNATHTFLTHGKIVDKYWDYFENTKFVGIKKKRHLGVEKNTTNKLYNHIPGFSPIPAVAIHLQYEDLLPPFLDWESLWNQNKPLSKEG